MRAPDIAQEPDGYDMVLRFRPTEESRAGSQERQPDLAGAVSRILSDGDLRSVLGDEATFTLRVLQPVIGSEPSDWELRLTLPCLRRLGEVLDDLTSRAPGLLGRLSNIPHFHVIDEGVPLYRAWKIT